MYLSTLEPNVFLYILESISEGLTALGEYEPALQNKFRLTLDTISDMMICSGCCGTLDNIVSYIFKQLALKCEYFFHVIITISYAGCNTKICVFTASTFPQKKLRQVVMPENNMFLKVSELHPEILQRILSTLLNVVMFEDCKNQWSMSRPLLVLILLYEDYFR